VSENARRGGSHRLSFHYQQGRVNALKAVLEVVNKKASNSPPGTSGIQLHATTCDGDNVEDHSDVPLGHNADPSFIGARHGTMLNAAAYFHLQSIAELLVEKLLKNTSCQRFVDVTGEEGTFIQLTVKRLKNASSAEAALEPLEFRQVQGAPPTHSTPTVKICYMWRLG
jgi:hypothetical protein